MHRFILVFGMALLWLNSPAVAKDKPRPPAISACFGKLCLTNLRWGQPSLFDRTYTPYIEGTLVNGTTAPLNNVLLQFALKPGELGTDLIGSAQAFYSDVIPPGAHWYFRAPFDHMINGRYVGRTEAVTLRALTQHGGRTAEIESNLRFDPVFDPSNRGAIKRWEKIHGKRQR